MCVNNDLYIIINRLHNRLMAHLTNIKMSNGSNQKYDIYKKVLKELKQTINKIESEIKKY